MQQAKAKARYQRVVEIIEVIASKTSSWLFVIIYGSAMIVVGINVPKIVVCEHRGDFCYVTRFWGIKAALDDLTPPKTQTKTSDKQHWNELRFKGRDYECDAEGGSLCDHHTRRS